MPRGGLYALQHVLELGEFIISLGPVPERLCSAAPHSSEYNCADAATKPSHDAGVTPQRPLQRAVVQGRTPGPFARGWSLGTLAGHGRSS